MILSNPYSWGPPTITLHWLVDPRGQANTLNPLDHPWNFATATVAKHRLRSVIRADREACGDGKWVFRGSVLGRLALFTPLNLGSIIYHCGKALTEEQVNRLSRPHYRWVARR